MQRKKRKIPKPSSTIHPLKVLSPLKKWRITIRSQSVEWLRSEGDGSDFNAESDRRALTRLGTEGHPTGAGFGVRHCPICMFSLRGEVVKTPFWHQNKRQSKHNRGELCDARVNRLYTQETSFQTGGRILLIFYAILDESWDVNFLNLFQVKLTRYHHTPKNKSILTKQ